MSSSAKPISTTTNRCTPRSSIAPTTAGLAGATVFRGFEGYGASNAIRTTRILSLSADLPIMIVIVDTSEHIEAFLPQLDELITEGLVLREPVDIVKYVGRPASEP